MKNLTTSSTRLSRKTVKLFYNGNIYAPQYRNPTALVVDYGRFRAIGTDQEILDAFRSSASELVDLQGCTVWPGLYDSHVHLLELAKSKAIIDCETETLEECLSRVEDFASNLGREAWIRGHGWNQNRWEAGYGTAKRLDTYCGGRPAYLTAKSLHAGWANSKALEIAGITTETEDPPGGMIQRDANGDPTGILFEAGAMNLVEKVIPPPPPNEALNQFIALMPDLWALGLVGVHDFDGLESWKILQKCHHDGNLKFRVRENIRYEEIDQIIAAGLTTDYGNDWLHIGNVKLFSDGALGPQTAAMFENYTNSDNFGKLLLSEDEIFEIGVEMVNNRLALTIHAIGDLANHTVLNAYERLRTYEKNHKLSNFKHRIEHVQIIHPSDLERLAKLAIIASVQPVHAPSDMYIADKYLGDRSKNAYPFRTLIENGTMIVYGSDAPVESVNPFEGIHAAVTRQRKDGTPGDEGWYPNQRLSLKEALEGFSINSAKISNRNHSLGEIANQKKADFIILKHNPFELPKNQLAEIKPLATIIEGDCVYQAKNSILEINEVLNNLRHD